MRLLAATFLFFSLALLAACSESFTDPRDGKSYDIVKIGNFTWFAENLNYETDGSFCPDGDSKNCSNLGRLYTWDAARKACPEGWRLPDSSDFVALVEQAGGLAVAGESLKSTTGWFKKGNGVDALGFGALPAGYCAPDNNSSISVKCDGIGGFAYFWSSMEAPDDFAYYLYLDFSAKSAVLNAFPKSDARSVRCVKCEP